MNGFLSNWAEASTTSIGLFWMALWAFGLGYLISSMIQVFITHERMRKAMGKSGFKSVSLGGFFGFLSSSCSFAALSATRALFTKGAGLIPSLAFLLASTNLVVELGIIIFMFLGWQFVVGEYVGGLLLILLMVPLVKVSLKKSFEEEAREKAKSKSHTEEPSSNRDWKAMLRSKEAWVQIAQQYWMEWGMVWKDVSIGFTLAGVIAAFVPRSFFQNLFVGAGSENPAFWELICQSLVGPVAAFFTFIGSMGNIPLAAVLHSNGVAFAGIMAFIFSDLVVLPVLRIQAGYYGWKMALYILGVFFIILVSTSLILHYSFSAFGILPDSSSAESVTDREFFKNNYGLYLNVFFLILSGLFIAVKMKTAGLKFEFPKKEKILFFLAILSYIWLGIGLALSAFI